MGLKSAASRNLAAAGGLAAAVILAGVALAQTPPAPAEALFQSRCASCHDPNIERAPSRATLALMSPAQISGALESGLMAPMAAGLSKGDIQMLAAHLGASASALPVSAAASTPAATTPARAADPTAKPVEWRAYNGNYASTRYAPLDQINKDTVRNLHVAWRQSLTPDAPREKAAPPPSSNNQTTPLMVGGLVYFSTGIGGVAALDAATGKVVWNVDPIATADAAAADDSTRRTGGGTRAISYYADGADGRIIALVGGRYLTALNAKTGKRIANFGANGQVDLRQGQSRGATSYTWRTGPTVIVRGVVIIGSADDDGEIGRAHV